MKETAPGLVRGFGAARLKFESIYPAIRKRQKTKRESNERLEKLGQNFGVVTLQKSIRIFEGQKIPDSVFLTALKLISDTEEGAICISKDSLFEFLKKESNQINFEESLYDYISKEEDSPIIEDSGFFYLKSLHRAEMNFTEYLNEFLSVKEYVKHNYSTITNLSEEQSRTVASCLKNRLSLVAGGPGTGKTTILDSILRSLLSSGLDPKYISLSAPTGKAAKRIKESCLKLYQEFNGLEDPSTIHRLLGYSPSTGKFKFNEKHKLDKKIIIIDESSMADIFLFEAIFASIERTSPETKIILCGDPDQLLSVSSGAVFGELVNIKNYVNNLSKSFRQTSSGMGIQTLASYIKNGNYKDEFNFSGIQFIDANSEEEANEFASNWLLKSDQKKSIILTPYRSGNSGAEKINENIMNKRRLLGEDISTYSSVLTKNLYSLGLFNGETGILLKKENQYFFIPSGKTEEIPIHEGEKNYFQPGYAITVHRSQGSEYDSVCFIIIDREEESSLINRRLIYTGITRAKSNLTIISNKHAFMKAIQNNGVPRTNRILERIKLP